MTDLLWIASYVILWGLVLLLGFAVFVLGRQVGLLHTRLPPYGVRMTNAGPSIGDNVESVEVPDLNGVPVVLGTPTGKDGALIVFISPGCSACTELAPALRTVARSDGQRLHMVLMSMTGTEAENREYARMNRLDSLPYVVAPDIGSHFAITSTPYVVLIDETGEVRAKGIANNLEQLEGLIDVLSSEKQAA